MNIQERILKVMPSTNAMRKFIDEKPTEIFQGFKARKLSGSFILAYRYDWSDEHTLPQVGVSHGNYHEIVLIVHYHTNITNPKLSLLPARAVATISSAGKFKPIVDPEYYMSDLYSSPLATRMRDATGFWFAKEGHYLVVKSRMNDNAYRYAKPNQLEFCYLSGEPYGNVTPVHEEYIAIPEVRRQWLRDSKKFKQVHKTLYRLGVINTELEKGYTDTDTKTIGDLRKRIVERMKAGQGPTPQEARDIHFYYILGYIPTRESVRFRWESRTDSGMVDAFFAKESKALREAYGVFGRLRDLD